MSAENRDLSPIVARWRHLAGCALLILLCACTRPDVEIHGAGATFPAPLYARWATLFHRTDPDVKIVYSGIGSGAGIRAITEHSVHFGASDALLTPAERRALPGELLSIPVAAGPVVLAYNLPDLDGTLVLDSEALVDIYFGRIDRWDDPKLRALNPDLRLPALEIHVAHRADRSGTTDIFTRYLSAVNEQWNLTIGHGKSVSWPSGDDWSGVGNDGVAHRILLLPGGIGYVGLKYAQNAHLRYATLINRDGYPVRPTVTSVQAAIRHAPTQPGGLIKPSLINMPGADTYPICGFTYLLVYRDLAYLKDPALEYGLIRFLRWVLTTGQDSNTALHYTPLPEAMRRRALSLIDRIATSRQRNEDESGKPVSPRPSSSGSG